jgi:CubicO group peptidase (beta-lactamase class C family)/flagellar hook assembly protein FlgD
MSKSNQPPEVVHPKKNFPMKPLIIRLSVLLLFFTPLSILHAQIEKGALIKGKLIASIITPAEKHQYPIHLEKDQFVFLKLMQKGVDIKITTYDSKGKKIETFDSPNGKNGPELFTLISGEKGTYKIEVAPFDEKEPTGSYELIVKTLKPKATLPNEQIDEVFAPWDNKETPGAAVAIVKEGAIVYKKGYGLANLEYDIPITPSSIFHIASVSKQFTVFSILLLEKQGKLSLDDDIRTYLPEVPDFGKTITLRHLASHTSGLRDQWELLVMAGWRMDDVITKEQILKLLSHQKELNFNPGEEYAYCNTGFTLLAEVVARISHMSFAEFTQKNIFEPLKMKNTLFYDDHEKIVKNRTYSYHADSTGFKKSVLNYANVGATSLFTTVEDLSLWALNFSNPIIGDASIFTKMKTPAVLNNGTTFGGALGQFVGTYKGLNEIQHGGADAGYRSYLTRFPDEKLSVIVFSNSADFNPAAMAHKVADIYLKDKIKTEEKEVKADLPPDAVAMDSKILNTYVGDFELLPGFTINISESNGKLSTRATGQSAFSLISLSATEFKVEGVDAKVEFIPNGGENIKVIKLHQGGQIREATRLKVFNKAAVKLTDFTGDFYSAELATTYSFAIAEGKLTAKHPRVSDFSLNPTKEDVFSGEDGIFGQVDFIRDPNAKITGFKVSNGRVRNLYFEKIK